MSSCGAAATPLTMNTKEIVKEIWENQTEKRELSPLLQEIGAAIQAMPEEAAAAREMGALPQLSKRISGGRSRLVTINTEDDGVAGEWHVSTVDLYVWHSFYNRAKSLIGKEAAQNLLGKLDQSLAIQRLYQALLRYKKKGVTREHLLLIQELRWDVCFDRRGEVSIFVGGEYPFGNRMPSAVWGLLGREIGSPEWRRLKDAPEWRWMNDEEREKAWEIFDELGFAAAGAAEMLLETLPTVLD